MIKQFLLFLMCFYSALCFSQGNNDSLWSVYLRKSETISHKLRALDDLAWNFFDSNPDSSYYFALLELKLAKTLSNKKEKLRWQGKALNNIGISYQCKSDFPNALDNQFKSLKLKEQLGDKKEIAICFVYIGNIYYSLSELQKSLKYYVRGLKLFKNLQDKEGIAGSFLNISSIYIDQKDYKKALNYQLQSLQFFKELKDNRGLAYTYGDIGRIYFELANYIKALDFQLKSLALKKMLDDQQGIAYSLGSIGDIYYQKKEFDLSLEYLLKSVRLCQKIGSLDSEEDFQRTIYKIYKKTGKSEKALWHYERYILLKDSIFKAENQKQILLKDMDYEFEKKQAIATAKQEKKDALVKKEKQRQNSILFSVLIGLLLVAIFTVFLYNRFRITHRQKSIIEQQKQIVDEKNSELNLQYEEIEHQKQVIEIHQQEIIDSITYAKHIQDAILPPTNLILEKLPETFVLYKPKDIVAGDFYWMEELNDTILIAVADCTGHGVPGAMVSVVCSNALNRAVKEFHLMDTGKILDKVTDLVIETFEKSNSDVKDGMDISLLSIHKKTKEMHWSGANNPLWYFDSTGFQEIVPDKQPIGKNDLRKSFTSHRIEYSSPSTFYLFTDGFADQFGGPKGKKYKYRQLEETLSQVSMEKVEIQLQKLDQAFQEWKGDLEQVDDVCVIGIKI